MATLQCTTPTNLTPPAGGWTPTALVAAFGARELRPGEAPTLRQVLDAWSDSDVRRAGALAERGSHLYWIATRLLQQRAAEAAPEEPDLEQLRDELAEARDELAWLKPAWELRRDLGDPDALEGGSMARRMDRALAAERWMARALAVLEARAAAQAVAA